jgi:hypothetical protein
MKASAASEFGVVRHAKGKGVSIQHDALRESDVEKDQCNIRQVVAKSLQRAIAISCLEHSIPLSRRTPCNPSDMQRRA